MTAHPRPGNVTAGANGDRVGSDRLDDRRQAENRLCNRQQSGVALIVVLVLLTAVTVVTASAMNTATLQIVMAGNVTSYDLAFQAASTGIDLAIAQGGFSVESPGALPLTRLDDSGAATEAVVAFSESTPVPDAAFSLGEGSIELQAFHFEVTSVGTGPRNSVSTQQQGFYVLGPADPAELGTAPP